MERELVLSLPAAPPVETAGAPATAPGQAKSEPANGPKWSSEEECAARPLCREASELGLFDASSLAQAHSFQQATTAGEARGLGGPIPSDLHALLGRLVRRAAWGGDRHRGIARIELGAGELAGATLTVSADGREVSVALDLPPGVAGDGWQQRLEARLARSGLQVSVDAR